MDYKQYFERIGIDKDTPICHTKDFLSKIQSQHVMTVPYENIDIVNGKALCLDKEYLFDKIVTRRRGGFCFELNGLFRYLLEDLGFKVDSYFARFLRGEKEIPVRRHHVLTAECDDGVYVCDVGIGQIAPRFPLLLNEGQVQVQGDEAYRFDKDENLGFVLWEMHNGEWRRYFSFTEDKAFAHDFIQPCFYCEKHPDSPFHKELKLAIKTPDGRKSIEGNTFKQFTRENLIYIEENASELRLKEILEEHFGIVI